MVISFIVIYNFAPFVNVYLKCQKGCQNSITGENGYNINYLLVISYPGID